LPTRAARDATKREHCGGILSECLSFDAGSRRVGLAKSWLTALARTCSFEEVGRSVPPIWPGELYLLFPLSAEVVCRNGATCGSKTGAAIFAVTRFAAKYSAAKYLRHVSGREPTGFELCASVWTSQTPTLVPTANTRRDFFLLLRVAVPAHALSLSITGLIRTSVALLVTPLSRARRSGREREPEVVVRRYWRLEPPQGLAVSLGVPPPSLRHTRPAITTRIATVTNPA
jgi:hypothetical protein